MRFLTLILSVYLLVSPVANAEDSQRELAEQFVELTKMEEIANMTMRQGLVSGLANVPYKDKYQDIIDDVAKKYLSFELIKDQYIDYHTKIFTKEELQDIVDFCKTPAGQKYISHSPGLNQYLSQLMIPLIRKAVPELVERMKARTEELSTEKMRNNHIQP